MGKNGLYAKYCKFDLSIKLLYMIPIYQPLQWNVARVVGNAQMRSLTAETPVPTGTRSQDASPGSMCIYNL